MAARKKPRSKITRSLCVTSPSMEIATMTNGSVAGILGTKGSGLYMDMNMRGDASMSA
ncbi:hypothetical protein SAMN02745225_01034 [Ferrithrix thermotolerans DSM 19514]|uniref:Uncharacterized protein n=1 Tax=Ferrithrix thermotolerans DSM 19514 TaxID=1121881 RepID=A0A1M4UMF1_9ACTN|nr:hypothetical protein SAMN02745225_01034 [Ferrithrix thermotolerans DSM 19514]